MGVDLHHKRLPSWTRVMLRRRTYPSIWILGLSWCRRPPFGRAYTQLCFLRLPRVRCALAGARWRAYSCSVGFCSSNHRPISHSGHYEYCLQSEMAVVTRIYEADAPPPGIYHQWRFHTQVSRNKFCPIAEPAYRTTYGLCQYVVFLRWRLRSCSWCGLNGPQWSL